MTNDFWFYVFCALLAASGILCLAVPDKIISFRRSRGWGDGRLSGGMFYSTRMRVKVMGFMQLVIAMLAIVLSNVGR